MIEFTPAPEALLEGIAIRKTSPKTKKSMKFFEKHLNEKQCAAVWKMMQFYHNKLPRS